MGFCGVLWGFVGFCGVLWGFVGCPVQRVLVLPGVGFGFYLGVVGYCRVLMGVNRRVFGKGLKGLTGLLYRGL